MNTDTELGSCGKPYSCHLLEAAYVLHSVQLIRGCCYDECRFSIPRTTKWHEWLQTCYFRPPRPIRSLSAWSCVWSDRWWSELTLRHSANAHHWNTRADVFTQDEVVPTRDVCRIRKNKKKKIYIYIYSPEQFRMCRAQSVRRFL